MSDLTMKYFVPGVILTSKSLASLAALEKIDVKHTLIGKLEGGRYDPGSGC